MATHLKVAFVTCLLFLTVMEQLKPAQAKKGERIKKRVKALETSMKEVKENVKALEECKACSKISELDAAINELQKKCESKPELADCGDPGVPVHGSKTGEKYLAGGLVTFTCDAGYQLEGPKNLVCSDNGSWSSALPKCNRLCKEPAPPENGIIIGSDEGKSVTYKCNNGYELQGQTVRVCNEMGEWTGEEPTCKPKYVPPAVAGLDDSEILKEDASYLNDLSDFLKPVVRSNSHWKLCWRASVDGLVGETFHSLCDGKGPTLTIARVGQYIFGGYTSLSWTSPHISNCQYRYDSAAFLFSLVNKPGWKPLKMGQTGPSGQYKTNSVFMCDKLGPTFGAGNDLRIADFTEPGTSYSHLGTYGQSVHSQGGDFADSFLAGSYRFKTDEVEVFYEST